jgi:two-component system, OmpR family, sensor histidine kinase SenX3
MVIASGHRKSTALFIALGACVVALAAALGTGWIVLNLRTTVLLVLGVIFFGLIITGVVLNTIFLVREVRRNEQHDAFINAVTHELKTPVASIRLYLETLQRREIDDAKRQEFYGVMLADSDRLLSTIEQVLRAGRVGALKRRLHRSRIDFGELVQECLALARTRHHLPEEAIEYVSSAPSSAQIVMGDLEELKAAVSNLLDNAIKYSGPTVRVQVVLDRPDPKSVAVRLTDNGVGIPNAELKRIFRRFYRVPGTMTMRVKGTGLGLYIVRTVAEKHGGRAWAESAGAGLGSTFTLQLPCAPPEAS